MYVYDLGGEKGWNLPSSWLCSAILRFHFCPKPVHNKSKMWRILSNLYGCGGKNNKTKHLTNANAMRPVLFSFIVTGDINSMELSCFCEYKRRKRTRKLTGWCLTAALQSHWSAHELSTELPPLYTKTIKKKKKGN